MHTNAFTVWKNYWGVVLIRRLAPTGYSPSVRQGGSTLIGGAAPARAEAVPGRGHERHRAAHRYRVGQHDVQAAPHG